MLELTTAGLYCAAGDFFIDPWEPVERAVITHGHADHAHAGCRHYLAARPGGSILRQRLGSDIRVRLLDYGQPLDLNGCRLSLHPAGHILGSAQVRIERAGQVWVVSGDYKTGADPTCTPLEPLRCHTFVTESTFGLPVFKWRPQKDVLADINSWWRTNAEQGRTSIVYAYALGKAQRILAGLDPSIGPIFTHGAVENVNSCYRQEGVHLPATRHVGKAEERVPFDGALVIAPPSADIAAWTRKFKLRARALASGWMHIRGNRRRRGVDRGFVLSDHCDWDGLNRVIGQTGAESVWVTHGYTGEMVRWLKERGYDARVLPTRYEGEVDSD